MTIVLFLFIGVLDLIRFNLHFLDPFNNGLKDYEVTDIVFSRLQDNNEVKWCDELFWSTPANRTGRVDRHASSSPRFSTARHRHGYTAGRGQGPGDGFHPSGQHGGIPNLVLATRLGSLIPGVRCLTWQRQGITAIFWMAT